MIQGSYRPPKQCSKYGCTNKTTDRYCKEHSDEQTKQDTERYKYYNNNKRNKSLHSFYTSKSWKQVRHYKLVKAHYLCEQCKDNDLIKQADVVHHIKYLEHYPELALSLDNLICLCHKCHNNIHAKDKDRRR